MNMWAAKHGISRQHCVGLRAALTVCVCSSGLCRYVHTVTSCTVLGCASVLKNHRALACHTRIAVAFQRDQDGVGL